MAPTSQDILTDSYYQNLGRRLTRVSLVLTLGVVIAASLLSSWKFAVSFLFGAIISYLNFSWMNQGVDRLVSSFSDTTTPFPHSTGATASSCRRWGPLARQALNQFSVSEFPSTQFGSSRDRARPSLHNVIFKYFLRYGLIGVTLYAIVRFRFFDAKGVILGLLLFVAAVLCECIYLVIKTLLEERDGRT
ncbi:MAG TPA: ATP synthase subunit I [Terriglobia bacterium]|nr:ATP synthase subunit I [Terriglobia bacterium]